MRLRADFWVAAYLRRCNGAGASAVLQRRGDAEAGAIFILIDCLDGGMMLLGPAPHSENSADGIERVFARLHREPVIDAQAANARLAKEIAFDSDLWVVAVEDRQGRSFVDLA